MQFSQGRSSSRATLSPRDLAAAIGVSESSVKRWVDRGVIRASRTAGGHRRIPVAEAIRFVRETQAAVVEPARLGIGEEVLGDELPSREAEAERLFELLRAGAEAEAGSLVVSLFLRGRSLAQLVDGPLRAAMAKLGELWLAEEGGIFREHRATDIALRLLVGLRGMLPEAPRAPRALGCAPAGDPYVLPSLAAAAVLDSAGLAAVNLGPATPPAELAAAAVEVRPALVWLSVSHAPAPAALEREVRALLARLGSRGVPLVIGGNEAGRLSLPASDLLYVGASMGELEALVKGLRLAGSGVAR